MSRQSSEFYVEPRILAISFLSGVRRADALLSVSRGINQTKPAAPPPQPAR